MAKAVVCTGKRRVEENTEHRQHTQREYEIHRDIQKKSGDCLCAYIGLLLYNSTHKMVEFLRLWEEDY